MTGILHEEWVSMSKGRGFVCRFQILFVRKNIMILHFLREMHEIT